MAELHLQEGQQAPDFTLLDQAENKVSLSQHRGHKVLVYFFPKADTPGCTKQSCGLRDIRSDIDDTVIFGISTDQPAKQKKFDDKYGLGFPLLSDPEHTTAEAYGVWGQKSMMGKKYMGIHRSSFLIDATGSLEHVWYKVSPAETPINLITALSAK